MAAYDLEEQEQLAELKAWWKEHGGTVILGATLALAAFGAWNGWVWYQRSQGHPGYCRGDSRELPAHRLCAARGAGFGQGPVSGGRSEDRARAAGMGRRALE